jgi:hypothetical protein
MHLSLRIFHLDHYAFYFYVDLIAIIIAGYSRAGAGYGRVWSAVVVLNYIT